MATTVELLVNTTLRGFEKVQRLSQRTVGWKHPKGSMYGILN